MEFRTLSGRVKFAPLAPHFHLVVVVKGDGTIAGHPLVPGAVWCVPAKADPFEIESADGCELLITYPSVTPTPCFYRASTSA